MLKSMSLGLVVVIGVAAALAPGPFQKASYAPTGTPLEYLSENDYMLWFLQGVDTAGQPVSTRTQETHSYSKSGDLLEVAVQLKGLDKPFESKQTMKIRRTGRVVEVDGVPVAEAENARVDFLPRMPASGPLETGRTWVDSVSSAGSKPYGETHYCASRTYRVVGPTDIEGIPVILIVGEGTLTLRQGGWQNEQQGVFWWQEVEGPVVDSVWFDPEAGHLIKDVTAMDLVGMGGVGNGQREMKMESGLRSRVERTLQRSRK